MPTITGTSRRPPRHSFHSLMGRLSSAGFSREFVRTAVLPDWWSADCDRDPSLLQDVEIRIARFLGCSIEDVSDPARALMPLEYAGARLRRTRNAPPKRLVPAIHAALRIASAVVRNLRNSEVAPRPLPRDPNDWRAELLPTGSALTLNHLLSGLWERGIPVVPVDQSPVPSFQGMACVVEQRPVILILHRHDAPARVAFTVVHEAGHIAAGDCEESKPVIDEEEGILDDAPMERRADNYASRVLMGDLPGVQTSSDQEDALDLAKKALELEQQGRVDAAYLLLDWAHRTADYETAMRGVRALYRHTGARRELLKFFDAAVNLEAASETDRGLLACIGTQRPTCEAAI